MWNGHNGKSIGELFNDRAGMDAAMAEAFYSAVRRHRQGNVPMIFWKDGKALEINAWDVHIPDDETPRQTSMR